MPLMVTGRYYIVVIFGAIYQDVEYTGSPSRTTTHPDVLRNFTPPQTGICIRTIEAHTETVAALVWVPDGSSFISGSQDRKINLWVRYFFHCAQLATW